MLSILWGWQVDRVTPDKYDLLGGWIALLGVISNYVRASTLNRDRPNFDARITGRK
ncbi:MAG: hypothetical protein MUD14_11415 [Hydrococcus sp. Prado102]|nr:hypothetical protein [Hydrococcus sp. Prado102]